MTGLNVTLPAKMRYRMSRMSRLGPEQIAGLAVDRGSIAQAHLGTIVRAKLPRVLALEAYLTGLQKYGSIIGECNSVDGRYIGEALQGYAAGYKTEVTGFEFVYERTGERTRPNIEVLLLVKLKTSGAESSCESTGEYVGAASEAKDNLSRLLTEQFPGLGIMDHTEELGDTSSPWEFLMVFGFTIADGKLA